MYPPPPLQPSPQPHALPSLYNCLPVRFTIYGYVWENLKIYEISQFWEKSANYEKSVSQRQTERASQDPFMLILKCQLFKYCFWSTYLFMFCLNFFGGLECVAHSFASVVHLGFLRDVAGFKAQLKIQILNICHKGIKLIFIPKLNLRSPYTSQSTLFGHFLALASLSKQLQYICNNRFLVTLN